MISDRTKQFIFNALIKDLSNVEMIRHEESLWFIDREKKYWYLELVKTGKLYWRYQFFTEFFEMYSIERNVYEPIIKEFVELVLNNRITTTAATERKSKNRLEDTLNSGNPPLLIAGSIPNTSTDLVLDNGITSTEVEFGVFRNEIVEDVLNNGVTSSRPANKSLTIVDSVLTNGITSMGFTDKPFIVESVLTNGITNITSLSLPYDSTVNLVLNETVNRTAHLNSARESDINVILTPRND